MGMVVVVGGSGGAPGKREGWRERQGIRRQRGRAESMRGTFWVCAAGSEGQRSGPAAWPAASSPARRPVPEPRGAERTRFTASSAAWTVRLRLPFLSAAHVTARTRTRASQRRCDCAHAVSTLAGWGPGFTGQHERLRWSGRAGTFHPRIMQHKGTGPAICLHERRTIQTCDCLSGIRASESRWMC